MQREQRDRHVDGRRGDHPPRQEARVAGADEDAVEREHGAVERHQRREQRPDLVRLLDHRVVAGEGVRDDVAERQQDEAEQRARRDRPPDHPRRRRTRPARVIGAEHPPDHHLPGDRDRVEHEREEDEQLEGDLVRGERGRADAGEHRGGDEEGGEQRGRADRDLAADLHQRADPREVGRLPPRRARLHPHEGRAHPHLGDHGAPRRAGEAPAEAVDEQHLEHHVDRMGGDQDVQRRAQVGDPAQEALAGRREHEERRAERGDPQVARRLLEDLALPAHQHRDRAGERDRGEQQHDADDEAEPQRLRAEPRRLLLLPGAVQARDARRGAVGEEVEDRERGGQRGRRDRERRELERAEMADDRGVDEQVERLGGQRAERGHGEPEDLAVVG